MDIWLLILVMVSPEGKMTDVKHIDTYRNKVSCERVVREIKDRRPPRGTWTACIPTKPNRIRPKGRMA